MAKIKVSKGEPPFGYSSIGLFKTKEGAQKWVDAADAAGQTYPFYLNYDGVYYTLWRKKGKGSKMTGLGWENR